MRIPAILLPHTIDIRTSEQTATGPVFGDWVTVRANVDDTEVLSAGGSTILSSATIDVDPENYAATGSQVLLWKGTPRERTAKVDKATYAADPYFPYAVLRVI